MHKDNKEKLKALLPALEAAYKAQRKNIDKVRLSLEDFRDYWSIIFYCQTKFLGNKIGIIRTECSLSVMDCADFIDWIIDQIQEEEPDSSTVWASPEQDDEE